MTIEYLLMSIHPFLVPLIVLFLGVILGIGACLGIYLFTLILDIIQWFDDMMNRRHKKREDEDMLKRY